MAHEPKCLMYRVKPNGRFRPVFITPKAERMAYWKQRGWTLLIDERDVRRADLDDTREQDEHRRR